MGSYTGFQYLNPMIGGGLYGSYDGSYLLDDEFSDTLAAGAVNGTPAVPGPGTRVVVDTDAPPHLSLAGGYAVFTAHTVPADGDPGYSLDPVVRVAGRVLLIRATIPAVGQTSVGFDADTIGYAREHGLYFTNAGWTLYMAGTGVMSGTSTAGVHTMAFVLRAAGVHVFLDNILLWINLIAVTTPLYPAIRHKTGTWLGDFIRIPAQLWSPTPIVSDSFNRGNGVLGSTDGAAVGEVGGAGLPWTDDVGTWGILGNKANASVLVGGVAIATIESGKTNGLVTGTLTRSAGTLGIVLRYIDSDNFMRAEHDGTNCRLITRIAGVEATAITAIVAIGAGEIRVISQGTSHALYLNNAQVGATTVIAGLTTGTRIGLHTTDTGNTFDNLYDFARGTGGEYVALDTY